MKSNHRIIPLFAGLGLLLPLAAVAGETCNTTPTATNPPSPATPATAPLQNSLACGDRSQATGASSTAYGVAARASGTNSVAIGVIAVASQDATTALGAEAMATGFGASAFGANASATGRDATALGFGIASGEGSNALGTVYGGVRTEASGLQSNAIGSGARATGDLTAAFGAGAQASAAGSVALGADSTADRANTVSVGSATQQRQITHVAAGTQATDAVNLSQLQDTLATARAYTDTAVATGGTASNAYTDNREAAIRSDMATADTQIRNEMVAADTQIRGDMTAADTQLRNDMVAADTQIRTEVQAGDAQTLQSARSYVDTRFAQMLGGDFASFDRRIDSLEARMGSQDVRISRLGAVSAAMTQMTANAMGTRSARGRLSIGAGWYGGQSAVSLGYGRKLGSRMSMTLGGAFSASERSAGVGFGVDL